MKELDRLGEPEIDERIERIVWKNLGLKSARQIADEAGVSPETVLRVKKSLLDGVDSLTLQEKRARFMAELQELSQEARERASRMSDEFFAGAVNSSVSAMKALLVELARMEKADNSKVEALNELRVRELLRLMTAVVESGVREVSEEFDLDESRVMDIFNARLVIEAQESGL